MINPPTNALSNQWTRKPIRLRRLGPIIGNDVLPSTHIITRINHQHQSLRINADIHILTRQPSTSTPQQIRAEMEGYRQTMRWLTLTNPHAQATKPSSIDLALEPVPDSHTPTTRREHTKILEGYSTSSERIWKALYVLFVLLFKICMDTYIKMNDRKHYNTVLLCCEGRKFFGNNCLRVHAHALVIICLIRWSPVFEY